MTEDDNGMNTKNIGLRGIIVADSAISNVDGENGILIYRGYDIHPLATAGTYEEVVHLLLHHALPNRAELGSLERELRSWRWLPAPLVDALKTLPTSAVPMDVLQSAVPMLAMDDPELQEQTREADFRKAVRLISRLPLIVSAWDRIRNGREVIEPKPDLGLAANFLYTLHGEVPDPEMARTMDVILILHAEHSFNASTFTARQVASTRAHIYAAITGALGSLSGELHGGANTRVFEMLREIGSVDNVHHYVTKTLDEGGRIMGWDMRCIEWWTRVPVSWGLWLSLSAGGWVIRSSSRSRRRSASSPQRKWSGAKAGRSTRTSIFSPP